MNPEHELQGTEGSVNEGNSGDRQVDTELRSLAHRIWREAIVGSRISKEEADATSAALWRIGQYAVAARRQMERMTAAYRDLDEALKRDALQDAARRKSMARRAPFLRQLLVCHR